MEHTFTKLKAEPVLDAFSQVQFLNYAELFKFNYFRNPCPESYGVATVPLVDLLPTQIRAKGRRKIESANDRSSFCCLQIEKKEQSYEICLVLGEFYATGGFNKINALSNYS